MSTDDNFKTFKDPLFDGIKDTKTTRENANPAKSKQRGRRGPAAGSGGGGKWLLGFVVVLGLGLLGYYLYQAQQEIESLGTRLIENQADLENVSQKLEASEGRIQDLNSGLDQSQAALQSQGKDLTRYKGLYENLKSEQDQQTRELEALNVGKADQSDVAALENRTREIDSKVAEAGEQITSLKTQTTENASLIGQNRERIGETSNRVNTVETAARSNTDEIASVRRSLERDYYNFEIREDSGYMKVMEVAVRLRDIDFRKRQYDLDVLVNNRIIRKKNQGVNEPIIFYMDGEKKPYEVVITRIDKEFVVGYLSIPKKG